MRCLFYGLPLLALVLFTPLLVESNSEKQITTEITNSEAFGDSVSNLDEATQQRFNRGFGLFTKIWAHDDGQAVAFNARSCSNCHREPMPGGSGTATNVFVIHSDAVKDVIGSDVFQRFKANNDGTLTELPLPKNFTRRKTPALYGLGLLEAVPVSELLENGRRSVDSVAGINGHLLKSDGGYGRFGWKGDVISLDGFVAKALATEMGLSTSIFPQVGVNQKIAVTDEQTKELSTYIRLLSVPPRKKITQSALVGENIFTKIGCTSCHSPTLVTGVSSIPVLDHRIIHPYSDLLLHDLGNSHRIKTSASKSNEFRTPPLWGLTSTGPPFLHDGRANTLQEAILAHNGEARRTVSRYNALPPMDQHMLQDFLTSL